MQLSILCSADSFLAAAGVSVLGCPNIYKRRLAFAFAACDMLATMTGARLHAAAVHLPPAVLSAAAPAVALAMAAGILALLYGRRMPALTLLAPVLLSLDNFAAGALDSSGAQPSFGVMAGLTSGLMAWAGFAAAKPIARFLSPGGALAMALGLVSVSFALMR
ncbi:MAG: hypothetical protein LAQ69_19525 [Acidobacteriia bacterium]|nr:hypothetical protein [Terriglobia bacterium]